MGSETRTLRAETTVGEVSPVFEGMEIHKEGKESLFQKFLEAAVAKCCFS